MTMNLGIMQMLSFNINPFEKDIPQLTVDLIIMLNKRTILIEIYKLMINSETENYKEFLKKLEELKGNVADLKDFKSTEALWRDKYYSGFIKKNLR